jgi:hypothetical protein
VTSGNVAQFSSGTLTLGLVPKCIYIWCAVPNSSKNMTNSDAPGYKITNLSISYNNNSGQFSNMKPMHLYSEFMASQGSVISHAECGYANIVHSLNNNGLAQFGLYGTVLRIPGTALSGIDWNKYTVGSAFSATLTIDVQAINLSQNANTPYLFVQVVNDNYLAITSPSTAQLFQGLLSTDQVAKVRASGSYELEPMPLLGGAKDMHSKSRKVEGRGGSFLSTLGKIGKFAWNNRDTIANVASKGLPLLGLGRRKSHKKRSMYGGSLTEEDSECGSDCECEEYEEKPKTISVKNKSAGSLISKSILQKRLK